VGRDRIRVFKRDIDDHVRWSKFSQVEACDVIKIAYCFVGVNLNTDQVLYYLFVIAIFLSFSEVFETLRGHYKFREFNSDKATIVDALDF
jgi:hypothetical protein